MKRWGLEQLLKDIGRSRENLEDKSPSLTNEVVVTCSQYFEMEKMQAAFFYPNIDLYEIDPFHVARDGHLVNEE